jgi:ferredoxin
VNKGYKVKVGDKVIVVGGGNVALDVARTVLRQTNGQENSNPITEEAQAAVDAARTALRLGAKEVHIFCVESRDEMPATGWEIEEAEKEGIIIHNSLSPKRIIASNGRVTGLETLKVKSVFDSNGNFDLDLIPETENIFNCDTVILAVGQKPDLDFIDSKSKIKLKTNGTIEIDEDSLQTTVANVFAGGDVAFGPRNVIQAVADGKKAADSIHKYLTIKRGDKYIADKTVKVIKTKVYDNYKFKSDYHKIKRQNPNTLSLDRRIGISEVENCYTEQQGLAESIRCLRCQVYTVFDSDLCILCGGCVDVCPTSCLSIINQDQIENNEIRYYYTSQNGSAESSLDETAQLIIKDDNLCIQCGQCYKRCPVHAITMETFEIIKESI